MAVFFCVEYSPLSFIWVFYVAIQLDGSVSIPLLAQTVCDIPCLKYFRMLIRLSLPLSLVSARRQLPSSNHLEVTIDLANYLFPHNSNG